MSTVCEAAAQCWVFVSVAFVLETRVNAQSTGVILLNLVFEGALFS